MNLKQSLSTLCGLFFLNHCLLAQEDTLNRGISLDPVTVTASVNPLQVSRTGRNITVIRGEQFNQLPVHSIDDLLRYVPGVEVQMRGPMGAQSDIVMRGGTFQQVLVILDGIRMNDPNTGHFNSYIPIAPAEIDRIEVLKGASSAIYGSEAVGGVIHIITKSFAARTQQQKSDLQVQAAAGEYGYLSANAGGFYQKDRTAFGGGILTNNTHGQPQRGTRGFLNNHTASLSLSQALNPNWFIALRSAYDQRDFGAQNFYTSFASDTANEKVTSLWNQLQLVCSGEKNSMHLDLGYKNVNDRFQYNPSSLPNENRSQLWQALLRNEHRFSASSALTAGFQYLHKKINSNDRGNHALNQAAAFLLLHQQLGESFHLSPALRLDWNERSGWELVPQVNLSYRQNNLQLRASAGKTIREADFTERFNNYNKSFVSGGSIGNPDLEAERSFSYEAGADIFIQQHLKISATLFNRHQNKLIDWHPTPYAEMPRKDNLSPTGSYALARNISSVTTSGAELDLQFVKNINSRQRIWSSLGLMWLQSKSDMATPSFYIASHARFLANFNIQYSGQRGGITVNGLYKRRNAMQASAIHAEIKPDFLVINSRADLYLHNKRAALFVQVDNIFDHDGQDLLGSALPGRWLSGGFRLQLF